MPKNYSSPLDGLSFEELIAEVDQESASDSSYSSQRRYERQSNNSAEFQIIQNYGKLSNRKNAPTFTLVDWNGYKRYDLRTWNDDYTVPFKGLAFNDEETFTLYETLSKYVPRQYSSPLHVIDMGKTKAKIYYVLSELSTSTVKGVVWNKQVSIVDWGYGPKYDFRKWTEDYEKCSKGICLNQSEIDSLIGILENIDL